MGLGGWIKDKASDAGDAVTDKIDDAGEYLEDAVEDGKETLGGLVNTGAHGLGDLLDEVGLEDASDFVDARGDDFADAMGTDVAEMQLGETKDAKQLIHGEAGKIDEVVTHLNSFASSMNSAATGLSGIDTGGWTGGAAEGYKSIASSQPGKWRTAGSAMSDAASAWSSYASTVTWAQRKAKEAITQYEKGKLASETAVDSHNTKVRVYNAGVDAGKTVEELPDKPGPFVDPGQADMEAAQQTLTDARTQRDEAADRARTSITSATSGAPQEPGFTDRVAAGVGDVYQMQQIWGAHATAGAFKATGEVVKFARGLNPTDPYNMRHPAAYLEGLSNTATGLIHTANHPTEVVSAIIGAGWTTDPAEAFGKLIPTIVGAAATGGAGGAAAVTARVGSRTAVSAAERAALRSLDDLAEGHHPDGDGLPTKVGSPPEHMSEWTSKDIRSVDDQLSDPTYHGSNRDIIENDYDVLGGRESPQQFLDDFTKPDGEGGFDWDWEHAAPNDGRVPGSERVLDPTEVPKLDRIGGDRGAYFGRDGDSFGSRSLPPDRLNFPRAHWETDLDHPSIRDGSIRIEQSEVAPAFGQHGGGLQYRFLDSDGNPIPQGELRSGDNPVIRQPAGEGADR